MGRRKRVIPGKDAGKGRTRAGEVVTKGEVRKGGTPGRKEAHRAKECRVRTKLRPRPSVMVTSYGCGGQCS